MSVLDETEAEMTPAEKSGTSAWLTQDQQPVWAILTNHTWKHLLTAG